MKQRKTEIDGIPSIVYGEKSSRVYLFVHGQNGYKEEAESFAETVLQKGWQVVSIDLPEHGERKKETGRFYPWIIVPELQKIGSRLDSHWESLALRATSIGAWFSMLAFADKRIEKSLFVSPILNMGRLIENMIQWAGVTKEELEAKKAIPTDFGQTLSWDYYLYAKQHPITKWNNKTNLLFGSKDHMTERSVTDAFAQRFACDLKVMENGEHWFHTEEQLALLKRWEKEHS